MRHAARLVLPGLITLAMFAGTMSLGFWQLRRQEWKQGILAAIDHAEASPPLDLAEDPPQFARVRATGWLINSNFALLGDQVRSLAFGPMRGAHLIVPLMRAGADPVLVDRGWVPDMRTSPLDQPGSEVTVAGYILPGQPHGWYSAPDDEVEKHFYTADPAAIGAALGLKRVAPFILVALGPAAPGHYPDPAHRLPRPPNNHLNYAITWFSLGFTALVVFAIWSFGQLRGRIMPPGPARPEVSFPEDPAR